MMHMIEGLIVPMAIAPTFSVEDAVAIPLGATGLAFVPVTYAFISRVAARFPSASGQAPTEFSNLSPSAVLWIERLSAATRVAYIETEYFGGAGAQSAAVWEGGKIVLGPKKAEIGPINDALRLLGVVRTETADEFDVAGLGRHRETEDWLDG